VGVAEHKVKDYPHYTTNKALKTQVSAGSREEGYHRMAPQGGRLQVSAVGNNGQQRGVVAWSLVL